MACRSWWFSWLQRDSDFMAHLKGKVEGVLHFTFKAALGWRLIWLKKFGGGGYGGGGSGGGRGGY